MRDQSIKVICYSITHEPLVKAKVLSIKRNNFGKILLVEVLYDVTDFGEKNDRYSSDGIIFPENVSLEEIYPPDNTIYEQKLFLLEWLSNKKFRKTMQKQKSDEG